MISNYFRIAFRNLFKQKIFSLINISGLAVGLACALLIFLWILKETNYDNFHVNKNDLYRVVIDFENNSQASLCGALGPVIKEEVPEIIESARIWSGWKTTIYHEENTIKSKGSFVDPSFLKIFSFPLISGDIQTALAGTHSLVVTKEVANKLFAEENAVGKTVQIKNRWGKKENFEITGVLENVPADSHIQFEFLFSFELLKVWYRPDWAERWSNFSFFTYVLAQQNSRPETISKKITDCYNSHKDTPRKLRAEPFGDVYLNSNILNLLGPSGNGLYIKIFSVVAGILIFIACINYMNLTTARAISRAKEVGLRKIVGARKKEIMLQNFGESILFAFLSIPLALLLVELFIPLFNSIIGKELLVNYMSLHVILGLIGLALTTGLISGIYPAVYMSAFSPAAILNKRIDGLGHRNTFRKVLVVFQFSASIIIIISALVSYSQMEFIKNKSLGFEKENLLYAWVPGKNNEVLKTELLKNPNIVSVGASGAQLDWIGWWSGINKWDGKEHEDHISFGTLEVGYDYLQTYKMEMADGRYYSKEFTADQNNSIIVNESAVKIMNLQNPVGKSIQFSGKDRTIIGVVKDFHFETLHEEIGPLLFLLYPQKLSCLGIRIKGDDVSNTVSYITKVFETNIVDEQVEIKFLDEQLNQLYIDETRTGKLINSFSFISIFIATIGLFGLASYSSECRKKEIGIRKVLGASLSKVLLTLGKEYFLWLVIANVIAAPLAYFIMSQWLQKFAYRVDVSWQLFLIAGVISVLTALISVGYQVIKAGISNPIDSIKYE